MNIYLLTIGPSAQSENDTVAKFEVMDGCPSKGKKN